MGEEDSMRGRRFLGILSWAHKDNAPSLQLSAMHRRIAKKSGLEFQPSEHAASALPQA